MKATTEHQREILDRFKKNARALKLQTPVPLSNDVNMISLSRYPKQYEVKVGPQTYNARGLHQHFETEKRQGKQPTFPHSRLPATPAEIATVESVATRPKPVVQTRRRLKRARLRGFPAQNIERVQFINFLRGILRFVEFVFAIGGSEYDDLKRTIKKALPQHFQSMGVKFATPGYDNGDVFLVRFNDTRQQKWKLKIVVQNEEGFLDYYLVKDVTLILPDVSYRRRYFSLTSKVHADGHAWGFKFADGHNRYHSYNKREMVYKSRRRNGRGFQLFGADDPETRKDVAYFAKEFKKMGLNVEFKPWGSW